MRPKAAFEMSAGDNNANGEAMISTQSTSPRTYAVKLSRIIANTNKG